MPEAKSYCRICTAYCGIVVEHQAGEVQAVRGDPSDPVTRGYTCIKGRQLGHQQFGPQRLRGCLVREPDGSHRTIESARAVAEIGERLRSIVLQHGPRAVATYSGTAAYANSGLLPLIRAWHAGFGSPSNYSTLTIDQPSKIIAVARQGVWGAGAQTFGGADVVLTIGNNPIVSGLSLPGGPPGTNPVKTLEDARRRGLRVICVDPRRSEVARRSDLHLQLRPGEDATLLAGLLRVILSEERHDRDFCRDHVDGLDALVAALGPFTPEYVAARTEVPADQLIEAARLFAAGPRGSASSGTGPDMGPHPSLSEHLISCLNVVCGRFHREGERIPNPGVLSPPLPRPAQAIAPELLPPHLRFGEGARSRFRGLGRMFDEMPTATLAEEILTPGAGQIRALVVVGGNPAVAVPDSPQMVRALEALDLLVVMDIGLTETAKRADYVLASRHSLEREDVTEFMDLFYEVPFAHYSKAVARPDFDVVDDWEPFREWARALGGKIELPGGEVPLGVPLDKLALLELVHPHVRVPFAEMRDRDGGRIYDAVEGVAVAPLPGMEARLRLTPEGICEELAEVAGEDYGAVGRRFSHLLTCRRMREVINSVGQDFPQSREKAPTNPAWMNAGDLATMGLAAGDVVEIESDADSILGVVVPTDELRPGVISMAHCWGRAEDDDDVRKGGSNTSRLMRTDRDYDPITGMARQTAIPVNVRPVPTA